MLYVIGEYERSSLMIRGVNNHGGVADLIGRRGLDLGKYQARAVNYKGLCGRVVVVWIGRSGN